MSTPSTPASTTRSTTSKTPAVVPPPQPPSKPKQSMPTIHSYRASYEPLEQDVPCIIREILYAPKCPSEEIAKLIEVALNYHNSSMYQLSIDAYIRAQNMWIETEYVKRKKALLHSHMEDFAEVAKSMEPEEQMHRRQEIEQQVEDELKNTTQQDYMTPKELLFFRCAIGLVYESAGNDELAISEFMEAKKFGGMIGSADSAVPYSCVGCVFYHVGQYMLALKYFTKSLELRQAVLGDNNVDTAISMINVAVCQQCLGELEGANEHYKKGVEVLISKLGHSHSRSEIASRNIKRFERSYLKQ